MTSCYYARLHLAANTHMFCPSRKYVPFMNGTLVFIPFMNGTLVYDPSMNGANSHEYGGYNNIVKWNYNYLI